MPKEDDLVQTRSEENGLLYFKTLKEAFLKAAMDKSIWKISFESHGTRIRLVSRDNLWILEDII